MVMHHLQNRYCNSNVCEVLISSPFDNTIGSMKTKREGTYVNLVMYIQGRRAVVVHKQLNGGQLAVCGTSEQWAVRRSNQLGIALKLVFDVRLKKR